jgi:hypothetical protein
LAASRQIAFGLLLGCACLCSRNALADGESTPSASPAEDATTAEARALFNEGTEKARGGDWAVALTAFERSDALHRHAVTTYNIGFCERALGRYTRARKLLANALAENAAHGGLQLPEDLGRAARAYLAELESQIGHAVVTVSPEGASVLVDGRPLERAVTDGPRPVLWAGTRDPGAAEPVPASTFQLDLDPGTHVFVVSKASYRENASTWTIQPGNEASVGVTLAPATTEPTPATAVQVPPSNGKSPGRMDDRDAARPNLLPAYLAFGVGAVGLAAGSATGILAIVDKNQGNQSAGTAADISTVTFLVGGAGVVAGVILWLTAPRGTHHDARVLGPIVPWVGPGGGGVLGTF